MTVVQRTKQYRELTPRSLLFEGMRVAIVNGYRNGGTTVHIGTIVQGHGDGAHVEYDYDKGRRHLHLSENMVELLEGNSLREPQDEPLKIRRTHT